MLLEEGKICTVIAKCKAVEKMKKVSVEFERFVFVFLNERRLGDPK